MRKTRDSTPIFVAIKSNQCVFNGYGAQETSDMLFTALIHPCMPVSLVCKDDQLWARLYSRVIGYQKERVELLEPMTPAEGVRRTRGRLWHHVSSDLAFRMNADGHKRFIRGVLTYRRKAVNIDRQLMEQMMMMGLLNPNATIQDDGTAKGEWCSI